MTEVQCTVYAEVYDEEEFYSAALKHAMKNDGASLQDTEAVLRCDDGDVNVAACWQTLIDPGISPPGCTIIESTAT